MMSLTFANARVSVVPSAGSRPVVVARAKAGNWLPGSTSPAHLNGSLPGDYGFDPLNLGKDNLDRLRDGEIINGRWAMLAVAGCLAVELAGQGNWFDAPLWAVNGGSATYLGITVPIDVPTLILVELVLVGGVEVLRIEEKDPAKKVYPGGAFDPMGFSKDATKLNELKLKEVKNGRLAMMAFLGFVSQHSVTGNGPIQDLTAHLSNPGTNNFATNGVSLPPFAFPFLY